MVLLLALLTLTRPTYLDEATYLAMAGPIQQHEAYWPADIPRVIHICFKTVEAVPAVVQSKWLSMNPSFKLIVHGDVECYSFLLEHFGAEIAQFYKKMPGQIKGCIFRVFYLYVHGGVYADVDVEPVVSLDHMVQPGEEFVTVGSQTPGLMNPILIIARRHEPVLLATMHAFIVRYRTTKYQYLDWSSCRQLHTGLATWFEADSVARTVWRSRIRGGAIRTARDTRLTPPNITGERTFLYRAPQAEIPSGGIYRIFTSVRPGDARNELVRRWHNTSTWRKGQHVPWTYSGKQLMLYDKWHRSLYSMDHFKGEALCNGQQRSIKDNKEKNAEMQRSVDKYVRELCALTLSHPNRPHSLPQALHHDPIMGVVRAPAMLTKDAGRPRVALVTGITGQDGSYLAELLLSKGYVVHGIVRRSSSFNTHRISGLTSARLRLHYGDLTDSMSCLQIISDVQPDEVYNLAAQSHVRTSFETSEYTADVDGVGVLRLLNSIRSAGLSTRTRFYQASTSELFGRVREVPQRETTPFYPRSPYGVAKQFAYWIVINYREAYGMHASNGILFNHESPRRGATFVTRKVTRAVARIHLGLQQTLTLGNLDATRDWGHARDYVVAMWAMVQADTPDDYVIATGKTISVRWFVETAFRMVGVELEWRGKGRNETGWARYVQNASTVPAQLRVRIDPKYYRPTEVAQLLGDPRKAREKLGWVPTTTVEELCREMVESDLRLVRMGDLES